MEPPKDMGACAICGLPELDDVYPEYTKLKGERRKHMHQAPAIFAKFGGCATCDGKHHDFQ